MDLSTVIPYLAGIGIALVCTIIGIFIGRWQVMKGLIYQEFRKGDAIVLYKDKYSEEVLLIPVRRLRERIFIGRIPREMPFLGRAFILLYCVYDPSHRIGIYRGKPIYYAFGITISPDTAFALSSSLEPENILTEKIRLKYSGSFDVKSTRDVVITVMKGIVEDLMKHEHEIYITPNIAIAITIPPNKLAEDFLYHKLLVPYMMTIEALHVARTYASLLDKLRQLLIAKIGAIPGWVKAIVIIMIVLAIIGVILHSVGIV